MRAFAFASAISLGLVSPGHAAPHRVVSLKLCTDELLMSVADPRQIASVTYLAQRPEEFPLWQQARAYPKNDGSLISVVRHRPDLVIDMGGGGRDSARIAERMGMKVLMLPYPQTLRDMEVAILRVGEAVGNADRARAVVGQIQRLRHSRPALQTEAIWLGGGGLTLGAASLGAEWMALAGLRQRSVPGDRITLEQLVTSPPSILLRSEYRSGQYSADQRWLRHPLVVRARAARIVKTDGRPWTCLGPPMIAEIRRLRALLER